jgi:hypothetical protein
VEPRRVSKRQRRAFSLQAQALLPSRTSADSSGHLRYPLTTTALARGKKLRFMKREIRVDRQSSLDELFPPKFLAALPDEEHSEAAAKLAELTALCAALEWLRDDSTARLSAAGICGYSFEVKCAYSLQLWRMVSRRASFLPCDSSVNTRVSSAQTFAGSCQGDAPHNQQLRTLAPSLPVLVAPVTWKANTFSSLLSTTACGLSNCKRRR